jgi:hypothetical protein
VKRALLFIVACVLCAAAAAIFTSRWTAAPRAPETAAVIQRVREVARLETLDVALYKKVEFAPDPRPSDSIWGAVAEWARHSLRPPRGKAIVFAEAHLSIDLRKLDDRSLRVDGRRIFVVLPPIETRIELRPGETEVIGSNLDSAETAQLLEHAKTAFQRSVEADAGLHERAHDSARRALRLLVLPLGFTDVQFVAALPAASRAG